MIPSSGWSAGDWVIYRKPKRSTAPGSRARNVMPASGGESYSYTVDKYWIVKELLDDKTKIANNQAGYRLLARYLSGALRQHFDDIDYIAPLRNMPSPLAAARMAFERAGRSFAMSHAPDEVKAKATDVLSRSAEDGGGVAEALERAFGV